MNGEVKVHKLLILVVSCAGSDMEGERLAPVIKEILNKGYRLSLTAHLSVWVIWSSSK